MVIQMADIDWEDPKRQALLALAAGLLSPVRSRGGAGFGEALGQGIQAGLLGFNNASQNKRRNELTDLQRQASQMQLDAQKRQQAGDEYAAQGFSRFFSPEMTQDDPSSMQYGQKTPAKMDFAGYGAYLGGNPLTQARAMPFIQAGIKDETPISVAPDAALVDRRTNNPIYVNTKADKPPPGFTRDASGNLKADPGWLEAQLQLRRAGAANTDVKVNSFTPASETAQAEFMKSTRTNYEALRSAPTAIANIERAKQLIPSAKEFMGTGGDSMLESVKFLNNRLGMNIKTEGVRNAEELRTRAFMQIMDNLKKMDAQPSQYQQKVMQDAFGGLGTDPNALSNVLDVFGEIIKGKVDLHNTEVDSAIQRGVKFPYDPRIRVDASGEAKKAFTKAEYDKLPPGASYIDPYGNVRRKP